MKNEFGKYLKTKRMDRGMTICGLAALIGKSTSYVSQLERGIRRPPKDQVINKITNVLLLNAEESEMLFDLAAKFRNSVPTDLVDYINTHPNVKETIRLSKECKIPETEWSDFAKSLKEKFMV